MTELNNYQLRKIWEALEINEEELCECIASHERALEGELNDHDRELHRRVAQAMKNEVSAYDEIKNTVDKMIRERQDAGIDY